MFHAGTPFFEEWERAYGSEAALRGEGRKKKEVAARPSAPPTAVTPGALHKSKPASMAMAMAMSSAAPRRSAEQEEEERRQREAARVRVERWQTRLAEIETVRASDPWKADALLAQELRKRQREESGAPPSPTAPDKKPKQQRNNASSASSSSAEMAQLKAGFAEALMKPLKAHLVAGRIADRDSCKHLTRTLTKELVKKELARGNSVWHPKLAGPAAAYADAYMEKLKKKGIMTYNMKKDGQK